MNQQQDWRFSLLSKARNLYMRLYILNFLLPRPRLTMYSFRNTCSFNLGLQSGRQQAQCSRNFKATLLELVSIKKEAIRSTLSKKSGLESTEQRGNFRKQFHRWGRAFERIFIFSIQQQATCSQRDRYQKRQTGRRFSRTCRRIILTVSRVSGVTAGFSSSLRSSNPGAALRNGRQNSDDVSTWVKVALMVKNSQNSSQRPCRLLNLILSLMKLPRQVSFLEVGQLLFSKLRQAICWKYFSEFSTSLRLSQHFFRPKQISSTLMKFPLRRMGSDNRARAVLKLVMAQRYCALSSWIWPLLQWQLTTFWESTSGKQKSRWILKYSSLYSSASSSISLLRNTFEKSSSTAILKIVDSVLSTRGRLSMTNWQASCLRSKSYRQLSRFIKDWKQKETCSALPGFYSYSSLTMTMYFRLDSSQNARMAGSTLEVAIYWAPMAMKASMKWISISPLQNCQLLTSRQSHKMSWHFSLKQLTRTLNSFSTWTTSSCSYSWSCQMCWVPVSMRPRALLSWGSYAGCTSSSVRRVRHPRTTVFFSSGLSWASWQPNRNRQARSFRNFLLLPSRQFLSRLLQADSSFLLSFLFLTWHSCSICPSSSLQLMKGSGLSQAILCSCPMNSSEQNPQVLTATRTEVTRAVSSGGSSRKTTMRTTTSTSCSSFSQEQTLEAVCLMRCLVRSLSLAMSWQASPGKSSLNRQQMVFIVQQLTCTSVAAHSSPENPAEDQYEEALGVLSSVSWLSSSSSPLLLCEQLSSRPCRYDSRFSQLAVQQLELEEEEEEEEEEEMQGVVLSRVTLRACRSLQNRSTKPDLEGLSGSYRAIISLLGQPRLPRKYVSVFSPGLSLMECETPKSLSTYRLMEGEKRVLEGLMSLCTNLTACSSPTHSLSYRAQVFLTFCSTISHSSIWNSMPSLQHTRSYTLLIITCGPMPSIEQILYMQYSFMALRIQSGQNRSLESSKPGMLTTCFRSLVNISRLMATFLPSTSASLTTPNVPCPKLDPWLSSFPPRFFLSSARFRIFSTWTTRQNRPMSTSNMHSRPFSLLLEGSTQMDPSLTIRPQKQSSYPMIFTL